MNRPFTPRGERIKWVFAVQNALLNWVNFLFLDIKVDHFQEAGRQDQEGRERNLRTLSQNEKDIRQVPTWAGADGVWREPQGVLRLRNFLWKSHLLPEKKVPGLQLLQIFANTWIFQNPPKSPWRRKV